MENHLLETELHGFPQDSCESPSSDAPGLDYSAESGRLGVIDIGSNSVRLVIFEGEGRSPYYFFNEKVLCGLGRRLDQTGRLDPDGRRRALVTIQRFRVLCDRLGVSAIRAIATAAVREAEDGRVFAEEVSGATGIRITIASGEDEGRLAAYGVLLGAPRAEGLVADLGGASLELAEVGNGEVGESATVPVGPLRLKNGYRSPQRIRSEIDKQLEACPLLGNKWRQLYVVGGSWRVLARIHMNRSRYPLHVLQEFSLSQNEARALTGWAAEQSAAGLAKFSDASESRLNVTPYGAQVLARIIKRVRPKQVILSAFGLREGVFYRHLAENVQKQDPLIAACLEFERRHARFPGFGEELNQWLQPLFPTADPAEQRLIRACCLVNDVEWREHPDYRAAIAFETMMRVNMSGVNHSERTFIASALLFRHKGGLMNLDETRSLALLRHSALKRAEILGAAIRVGESVTGSTTGILPHCPIATSRKSIKVSFPPLFENLMGESLARELSGLGSLVGKKTRLLAAGK